MHYIFLVTANDGYSIELYAESWYRASELFQRAPGAQGTRLHRRVGVEGRALAIATWESSRQGCRRELQGPDVQAIIESQADWVTIQFIGEFEAPEWEVLPDSFKGCDPDMPAANRALVWGAADRCRRSFQHGV